MRRGVDLRHGNRVPSTRRDAALVGRETPYRRLRLNEEGGTQMCPFSLPAARRSWARSCVLN